ncbi:MAG: hypothetical protein ABFS02_07550 [Pseudomonadota bacterium]
MKNFAAASEKLIVNTSIQEYFHDIVYDAVNNQGIEAQTETILYLVNLLTDLAYAWVDPRVRLGGGH